MPDEIGFCMVLNLHQPAGNLEQLLDDNEWEAKEILWALDRIPRSLWGYEDVARVHLSLSGTLLETLSSPAFQERVYGIVDCGSLLWHLQNNKIIEVLATAYYHPVLPLIEPADWDEQLARWQGIGTHLFHRERFQGFWPPEMGFCMEMIPMLKRFGFRYVLVDSEQVRPLTPMGWEELRYRPHVARFGDDEITVVVRDRELSNAQESGMDSGWFIHELCERTKYCDFPPLVTTCTDGDNGGWFRNTSPKGNFWTAFYKDLLVRVRKGWSSGIRPVFIHDYLDQHGAEGEVAVASGAWNTGWHDGAGFTQWTGSQAQRDAIARVAQTSKAVRTVRDSLVAKGVEDATPYHDLDEALWRVLRAETSCNFYWGQARIGRCHGDIDEATRLIEHAATAYRRSRTS